MRAYSELVRPSASWSDCSETRVRWSSLAASQDASSPRWGLCEQALPGDADRARADLGRLVPVHQGGGARAYAGDADNGPTRPRGADARSAHPVHGHTGETARQLRVNWRWLSVVALVNTAIPFWLLSWGETRIDSGLASIMQAAVPIFNAVIAFGFFREVRVTGIRLAGVAVGFVGVALLVSAQPHGKVLGALAVVGMALCYGVGGLLAGRHLPSVSPLVVALGTTAVAATVALPAGVLQAPHHDPGWKVILSVVALGIPGTAIAYLLFFGMV